jgi:predicted dehydrogenase
MAAQEKPSEKRIKAAVVGVGHLGRHHARIYAELPGVQLVAVADTNRKRAEGIAQAHGCEPCDDYRKLIGRVDLVSVAAPTELHYEISRAFLEAGVPVLVEKPITKTVEEGEKLVAIARKKGAALQVGHVERFNPAVMAVQQLIKPPKFIESHRLSPYTFRSRDIGVVMDLMIHDIDIIMHLAQSELVNVEALGFGIISKSEDIANARLTFASGCVANVTASRISNKAMRKIRLFSGDSYVSLDYGTREAFIYRPTEKILSGEFDVEEFLKTVDLTQVKELEDIVFKDLVHIEKLQMDEQEPLKAELQSFVNAVKNGTEPVVTGEHGVRAMKAAVMITEKIRTHSWGRT